MYTSEPAHGSNIENIGKYLWLQLKAELSTSNQIPWRDMGRQKQGESGKFWPVKHVILEGQVAPFCEMKMEGDCFLVQVAIVKMHSKIGLACYWQKCLVFLDKLFTTV